MTAQVELIFILMVIYQVKHYLADFPLQNQYMLRKVLPGWEFVLPLSLHCGMHAVMTLAICLFVRPEMWWLALVDFGIHFIMDRIKAADRYLGRFRDKERSSYWYCLGFDQLVHHMTHIYLVYLLVFWGGS